MRRSSGVSCKDRIDSWRDLFGLAALQVMKLVEDGWVGQCLDSFYMLLHNDLLLVAPQSSSLASKPCSTSICAVRSSFLVVNLMLLVRDQGLRRSQDIYLAPHHEGSRFILVTNS